MDNTLIYGLATVFASVVVLIVRYAFKSKCVKVDLCCGFISVKRDVDAELQEEHKEIELGINNEENKI